MHAYFKTMQLVEASGWEPLKRGQAKKTAVVHQKGCGALRLRAFCDCRAEILVTLKDGRRFCIDADGKPKLIS